MLSCFNLFVMNFYYNCTNTVNEWLLLLRNVRLFVVQRANQTTRGCQRATRPLNMLSRWEMEWIKNKQRHQCFSDGSITHGSCLSWNRSSSILMFTGWRAHRRLHYHDELRMISAPRRATCSASPPQPMGGRLARLTARHRKGGVDRMMSPGGSDTFLCIYSRTYINIIYFLYKEVHIRGRRIK